MLNTDNKIHCGDNLQIMQGMSNESVDLIYLDPPFFSGKNYEIIWGDDAEIRSFDDRFEGGIMVYIEWMKDRLEEMYRILKPIGSIYLHVDYHAVHYLKVEMDKIFGMKNFRNDIIWKRYSGVKNNATKKFSVQVDNILYYTKENKHTFNMPYKSLSDSHIKSEYKYDDGNGRKYAKSRGRSFQLSGGLTKKLYLDESKGRPITSLWDEKNLTLNTSSSESVGYPTQKPEALLERIIKASSNPGDIVFDPFCGCGTSAAVAQKLERKYIGIDISPIACKLIGKRVKYPESDIIGLPRNPEEIKVMEPHEFQNWVCQRMSARNTSPNSNTASGADGGVDGIIQAPLTNPKYHGAPIQVKRELSKSVGINTVKNFFATMDDLGKEIGFIVAISFGKGAKEQVAKYRNKGKVIIHLLTVEDIIDKDLNEIVSKLKN